MPRSPSPFEKYSVYLPEQDANLRQHTLLAGESLPGLAFKYYGTVARWTLIADRNALVDVRRLEPGTVLLIPSPPAADSELESL
jgi:nucleoid-associated protein YgaU